MSKCPACGKELPEEGKPCPACNTVVIDGCLIKQKKKEKKLNGIRGTAEA